MNQKRISGLLHPCRWSGPAAANLHGVKANSLTLPGRSGPASARIDNDVGATAVSGGDGETNGRPDGVSVLNGQQGGKDGMIGSDGPTPPPGLLK